MDYKKELENIYQRAKDCADAALHGDGGACEDFCYDIVDDYKGVFENETT